MWFMQVGGGDGDTNKFNNSSISSIVHSGSVDDETNNFNDSSRPIIYLGNDVDSIV